MAVEVKYTKSDGTKVYGRKETPRRSSSSGSRDNVTKKTQQQVYYYVKSSGKTFTSIQAAKASVRSEKGFVNLSKDIVKVSRPARAGETRFTKSQVEQVQDIRERQFKARVKKEIERQQPQTQQEQIKRYSDSTGFIKTVQAAEPTPEQIAKEIKEGSRPVTEPTRFVKAAEKLPFGIGDKVRAERLKFETEQRKEFLAEQERLESSAKYFTDIRSKQESIKLKTESLKLQSNLDKEAKEIQKQINKGELTYSEGYNRLSSKREAAQSSLIKQTAASTLKIKSELPLLTPLQRTSQQRLTSNLTSKTYTGTGRFGIDEFALRSKEGKPIRALYNKLTDIQSKGRTTLIENKPFTSLETTLRSKNLSIPKLDRIIPIGKAFEKSAPLLETNVNIARGVVRRPITTATIGGIAFLSAGAGTLLAPKLAGAGKIGTAIGLTGKVASASLTGLYIGTSIARILPSSQSRIGATTREESLMRFGESTAMLGAGYLGARTGAKTARAYQIRSSLMKSIQYTKVGREVAPDKILEASKIRGAIKFQNRQFRTTGRVESYMTPRGKTEVYFDRQGFVRKIVPARGFDVRSMGTVKIRESLPLKGRTPQQMTLRYGSIGTSKDGGTTLRFALTRTKGYYPKIKTAGKYFSVLNKKTLFGTGSFKFIEPKKLPTQIQYFKVQKLPSMKDPISGRTFQRYDIASASKSIKLPSITGRKGQVGLTTLQRQTPAIIQGSKSTIGTTSALTKMIGKTFFSTFPLAVRPTIVPLFTRSPKFKLSLSPSFSLSPLTLTTPDLTPRTLGFTTGTTINETTINQQNITNINPPTVPTPFFFPPPILGGGSLGGTAGRRARRRYRSYRRRFKYSPSLYGITARIKSPKSLKTRQLTGLELRGI